MNTSTLTANEAFHEAIEAGHFSTNKKADNYVGNYMYMGTKDDNLLMFKHSATRQYNNWKRYDIMFSFAGGCEVVCNRSRRENGDYMTIAHIYSNGSMKLFVANLPESVMRAIRASVAVNSFKGAVYLTENDYVEFDRVSYPTRIISTSALDYKIATTALKSALFNDNDIPVDEQAEDIDNTIAFYCSLEEFALEDQEVLALFLTEPEIMIG